MSTIEKPGFARAAIHGAAWRYISYASGKLMIFISTVVLARLLSKDDFGVVGFAITTIAFLDVMSDLGVYPALIYHPDDENTSVTAFWLGLVIGVALFIITWFAAPLVGLFFQDPRAIPVTRILALSYPINALGNTHEVILQKKLAFGRTFIPDLVQAVSKGLISIILALLSFGVWSLIGGQLAGLLVGALVFWLVTSWRPAFTFDLKIARSLLSYGLSIVSVDLLGILLQNLDYLLVGRYLGAEALGVYTLAFRLPDLLILQFARILSVVIFPIYTRMRDLPGGLTKAFALTTRYVSLLSMPLGIGIALLARPFVLTVFTDKWAEAIPIIPAIAMYAVFLSLAFNAGSVYKAQGQPRILTWLGVARLAMLFPALWWATTSARSILAVGWMHAIVAFFGGALNLFVAARFLDLPLADLFAALRPSLLAGFVMALPILAVLYFGANSPSWFQLSLGGLSGGLTYTLALWVFEPAIVKDASQRLRGALSRG